MSPTPEAERKLALGGLNETHDPRRQFLQGLDGCNAEAMGGFIEQQQIRLQRERQQAPADLVRLCL